jgi:hypothetical protein
MDFACVHGLRRGLPGWLSQRFGAVFARCSGAADCGFTGVFLCYSQDQIFYFLLCNRNLLLLLLKQRISAEKKIQVHGGAPESQ